MPPPPDVKLGNALGVAHPVYIPPPPPPRPPLPPAPPEPAKPPVTPVGYEVGSVIV